MSMSRDDMVVNSLGSSFDNLREWPYCVGSPEAIKDQSFLLRHARLALALAGGCSIKPLHYYTNNRMSTTAFTWRQRSGLVITGDQWAPKIPWSAA